MFIHFEHRARLASEESAAGGLQLTGSFEPTSEACAIITTGTTLRMFSIHIFGAA